MSLKNVVSLFAAALIGLTLSPTMAYAQTTEANTLLCPTEPPGELSAQNLELNETRQFGDSGMMVRLTSIMTGDPEGFQVLGFGADLFLPTATLRGVNFSGGTLYVGPVYRYSLCGSTYEIESSWGHPYFGNMLTIRVIPAGF